MRIFNLFLTLSVVICYGGLCNSSISFADMPVQAAESCHSMDKHESTPATLHNLEQDTESETFELSCCNESLTNSTTDQYGTIIFTHVPRSSIQNLNTKPSISTTKIFVKEHDPPDIQVLNSIFII